MYPPDQEKTSFMTDKGNYCYRVMPFRINNDMATYQRMMNKGFRVQIGQVPEVYSDDMIIKSRADPDHLVTTQKL